MSTRILQMKLHLLFRDNHLIFISREREAPVLPAGEKTSDFDEDESLEEEEEEEVCYKIGDLGHVV